MNNNNSFSENINNIIESDEKQDILEEKNKKSHQENNNSKNNDNTKNDSNKNIFTSLPLKLETNDNINIYESFLINELLILNTQNLFCIIKRKIIIQNAKVFYHLKKYSRKKFFYLIKSEILYLKISSSIQIIFNIYNRRRENILYQAFYILENRNKTNNHMFKIKFEIKFKNEKDNLINENTIKLKKLEKEVNDMENNIKILNLKNNETNLKINNLSKKEKQLNDTIKQFENYKSIVGDSKSSINNNSIYESDILSLENTIDNNKQQKEEKQKIINNFIFNVNELLNEYQNYIEILNSSKSSINNNININQSDDSNLNKSSIKIKDKGDSINTGNSSKISIKKKQNDIYKERFFFQKDKNK